MKNCIACAEPIQENAKLCRYCNTMQDDARFVESPVVLEQAAVAVEELVVVPTANEPKMIPAPGQHVCPRCGIHIVTVSGFESCSVCRGASKTAPLARMVNASDEEYAAYSKNLQAVVRTPSAESSTPALYQAKPGAPTAGIAIAAIILAFVIPIVGLVLGYSARSEIRNSGGEKGGDSLATSAIVIGWVCVVIAALYILIVLITIGSISQY